MLVARPAADGSGGITYTKHYFAGTQRVSSKIGTTTNLGKFLEEWQQQEQSSPSYPAITTLAQMTIANAGATKVFGLKGFNFTNPPIITGGNTSLVAISAFLHGGNEHEHYFFHPDHLGSSNYITNFVGEVSQHSEYFAFGETFIEEHKNSHNSPYKYNAKELDEESGLYYYGARYFDPRLSLMISVDQLMEKFAGRSPYEYCFSNPVNLTDPTGMMPEKPKDPPAKNIILNFRSNERHGEFDKVDFRKNGWEVINVNSITDARDKLKEHLGDTKADNIFIFAHGGRGKYYPTDDDGNYIEDNSSETGALVEMHSGGNFGPKNDRNWIFGNEIEDFNNPVRQKNLKPELIENIKALIEVSNSVKTGKNLIFANCNILLDKKFGAALVKNVQNIDIFMTSDLTTNYAPKDGKTLIPFSMFIDSNLIESVDHKEGWKQFNSSLTEPKSLNNLQITKFGVRVIK